jgi:PAS domain S-box-containing protein
MAESEQIRILCMEDDPGLARLVQKRLERAGYAVDLAHDGGEGLAMYTTGSYDVVVVDQAMPVHDGLEVIRILASQGPLPPTIMITGGGNEQIAVEAMKLGARDYIVKDVEGGYLDLLPTVIEQVLQRQRLAVEKQQTEEALRHRVAELEALAQVSAALRAAESMEEMLSIVLQQATQIFGAVFGNIFLAELETGDLVARASHPTNFYPLGLRHRMGEGITGHVAATGEIHITEDLAHDPLAHILPEEARQVSTIHCHVSLPLRTHERTVGVMHIALREQRPLTTDEVRLATAIADIAANALHRALVVAGLEAKVATRTAEIIAEREKSETILRSVGDAIVMTDLERRIQYVNEAFTTLTGYTAPEIIGQPMNLLFSEAMPEQDQQSLRLAMTNGETWQGEMSGQRKNGRTYEAAVTIAPMRDAEGNLVGYVSSYQDIGHHKDLDRARSRFITNVSHQLRTPVTTIQLYTYLLRQAGQPEKAEHHLRTMEQEIARLTHLIQDILEMTTLDSGQAVTAWEPVSVLTVIGDIVTRYRVQAEASALTLVALPTPPDLPVVKGSQNRLSQALIEIVENALIFTPAGGQVTLEVGTVEDEGQLWVTIAVRDTGPGIPPEEQERVFDRFHRGNLAESGHVPGTGLGLSIAQEIVRAHGGRLTVESQVDQGSTFTLWLRSTPTHAIPGQ